MTRSASATNRVLSRVRRVALTNLDQIYRSLRRLPLKLGDRLFYSTYWINSWDRCKTHPKEKRRISIAVSHYERSDLLHLTLKNAYTDDRVSEIVILDDGSSEETVERCAKLLRPFSSKVNLYRRRANLGVMATKLQAAELCSNPWCIILDSDNSLFECYLDAIFSIEEWRADTIYCPSRAFPEFDFRRFGEESLDFEDVCKLRREDRHRRFNAFINDGNYFVCVTSYSEVLRPLTSYRLLADVALANYVWLSQGRRLRLVHGAAYRHRVHPGSYWLMTADESSAYLNLISRCFARGEIRRLDSLLPLMPRAPRDDEVIERIPL